MTPPDPRVLAASIRDRPPPPQHVEPVLKPFTDEPWDIPYAMTKWALEAGCRKHDQIVHHAGSGPGGHNIWEAKRARRHHSYLIVFAVPAEVPS